MRSGLPAFWSAAWPVCTRRIAGQVQPGASITGEIVLDGVVVLKSSDCQEPSALQSALVALEQGALRELPGERWVAAELLAHCPVTMYWCASNLPSTGSQSADQLKLADMQTEITLATLAALQVGRLMDQAAGHCRNGIPDQAQFCGRPWTARKARHARWQRHFRQSIMSCDTWPARAVNTTKVLMTFMHADSGQGTDRYSGVFLF